MWDALEVASFRRLWAGTLLSMGAMQMTLIARAWLAFALTGSGAAIGLVAMARGVPRFVLAPIAGAATDRFDKRRMLIAVQAVRMILALILGALVFVGAARFWHLMVIASVHGLTAPFAMPTRTVLISDLVGADKLSNGIALDSAARNLNRVLAPAVAGVLLAWDPAVAFFAIAVGYGLAALVLARLPRGRTAPAAGTTMLAEVVGGFRYVAGNRRLLAVIATAVVVIVIGMPYRRLLPVFQEEVFGVGPSALGLMYTAVGVGAILSSVAIAYVAESWDQRTMLLGAGLGFGAALTAFAISPSYWLALATLAVVGFFSHSFLTLSKTLVMLRSDRAHMGRVMSIYIMGVSLIPVALVPIGVFTDRIGAPTTIAAVGVLLAGLIAIAAVITKIRPASRATQD